MQLMETIPILASSFFVILHVIKRKKQNITAKKGKYLLMQYTALQWVDQNVPFLEQVL